MTTREKVESQILRQTTMGVTLSRVFDSTWDDYNLGSSFPSGFNGAYNPNNPFPFRVGDPLAFDSLTFPIVTDRTLNLRITEITITPRDNVNLIAEIFYSTVFDRVSEAAEPDTNASWEEQFDMGSFVTTGDIYYSDDRVNKTAFLPYYRRQSTNGTTEQSWITDWDNDGRDEEDRPAHVLYDPTWVWTVRAYSSTMRFHRISDFYLSVNSNRWLGDYFKNTANRNGYFGASAAPSSHQTDDADDDIMDDRGRWLFTSCPIRRVRFNSWEYNFEFTFNLRWDWNKPYGITQDKYPTLDFKALLSGMSNAPNQQNQGVARS